MPGEGDLVGDEAFNRTASESATLPRSSIRSSAAAAALGHEAERVIDGGLAPVLKLLPNLGFAGPPVGRTLGNAVFLRPITDGLARHEREGESILLRAPWISARGQCGEM